MWDFPLEIKGFDENEILIFESIIDFTSNDKYELLCFHTGTYQTRSIEFENAKGSSVTTQNILGMYPYKKRLIVIG